MINSYSCCSSPRRVFHRFRKQIVKQENFDIDISLLQAWWGRWEGELGQTCSHCLGWGHPTLECKRSTIVDPRSAVPSVLSGLSLWGKCFSPGIIELPLSVELYGNSHGFHSVQSLSPPLALCLITDFHHSHPEVLQRQLIEDNISLVSYSRVFLMCTKFSGQYFSISASKRAMGWKLCHLQNCMWKP